VLNGSVPIQPGSDPVQKLLLLAKLGEYVEGNLMISQLVTLVFPIKRDASSLGLIDIKH